ncbi:MAG: hypothetical protein MI861_28860, partial [Pirellulales bacterium]|nr:hypothetical protein [Pirellulales bacterium]
MATSFTGEESYRGLPQLAGVCQMRRAVASDWSLDESVNRLKRLHYVVKRLHEMLIAKITAEPIYELKTAYSHHAYLLAEQVDLIRRRVAEMREPPLGLDKIPHLALQRWMDEVIAAPTTLEFLVGVYRVSLGEVLRACRALKEQAHPLADAPTLRVARLMEFELADVVSFGGQAIECLMDEEERPEIDAWGDFLADCIAAAGGLDGTGEDGTGDAAKALPAPRYSRQPYVFQSEPKRDERFHDPYNAGVNPEAFLYDERFSARDKT